ncbi:MAG: HAMP domain-containing histidine kinase [Sphingobium sp.]|nr:HAMP domain-containing histidine kinase [Sphingobium sp.]
MAAEAGQAAIISARLDRWDKIITADDLILRLQRAAGGEDDGRIAIPRVAAVARLTRRLKIAVTRPLLIGGRDYDIRLWVRAYPVEDGVALDFSEWQQAPHEDDTGFTALRMAQVALSTGGQQWRTNADMRWLSDAMDGGFAPADEIFFDSFVAGRGDYDELRKAVSDEQPFFGVSLYMTATGQGACLSGYPLYDIDGSLIGYHGVCLLQNEKAVLSADQGEEAVGDDLSAGLPDFGKRLDIALRQPLARIIANAETMKVQGAGPLRSDYADYASDIAHAGRHLLELVDDLADLQAIDRAGFDVAREDIDLADLGRRAAGLLGMKAADRHIHIELPDGDATAPAIGEFRRALQIIVNLLNNAIRYSPEHSTITIHVARTENSAQIVVADEGPGIAPEDQERVFEKFERLGRSDVVGSGLGLYISRRLARAMKGDIEIDSLPGQGARFTLWLPVE